MSEFPQRLTPEMIDAILDSEASPLVLPELPLVRPPQPKVDDTPAPLLGFDPETGINLDYVYRHL